MSIPFRLIIALVLGTLVTLISGTATVRDVEVKAGDIWFRLRGNRPPPEDIVIVAIDELSYVDLKVPLNQPWPRSLHAKLLERLATYQVKQVVFDILFLDPGPDPAADEALANAVGKLRTVLGAESALLHMTGPNGGYSIEELLRPYEPFRTKGASEALVALPDDSGTIRRFLATKTERTKGLPSLAEAAAGIDVNDSRPRPGPRDLINYYGPPRSIPILSYYQVLQEDSPMAANLLKGKTVMVGLLLRTETGPAQKDLFVSPFKGRLFGVEVHATAALNLVDNSWISRPEAAWEALGQGIGTAVFALLALTFSPVILTVCAIGAVLIWIFASYFLWISGFFLTGAFFAFVVLPFLVLGSSIYYYLVARKSEQTIRSAFELYVSPEMVPKLGNQNQDLKLGGEKLWVTALFTDIKDFTTIAENMPAEKTSEMLNAYFTEVMDVIFLNQGTLLKFIGDAVFALWGAPLKVANHAELAIRTALAIQAEVDRFNSSGRFPPLHTRIGIHTGPMLVGNLGSKRRFDYTAIGDSVNLASRTEGLNKYLGTKILFSEATKRDSAGSIYAVPMAAARVRGKREAVHLFTAFEPAIAPDALEKWLAALEHFRQRRFDQATSLFVEIPKTDERMAGPCAFYLAQCATLKDAKLEPAWSGEIDFEGK